MKSTFYSSSWASGTSLVLLEILNQMLREKKKAKQHKKLSQLLNKNKSGCLCSKKIKDLWKGEEFSFLFFRLGFEFWFLS